MMEIVLNYSTNQENNTEQLVDPLPSFGTTVEPNCLPTNANDSYLNELIKDKFNEATVIISVVILVLINIVVIGGNVLVIVSVFTSTKLRTVTNFFIGKQALCAPFPTIKVLTRPNSFPCGGRLSSWGLCTAI